MWMVEPKILCRKHLLGEHVECHMFVGTIKKGISLAGYVTSNAVEITSLANRHSDLATEMLNRGYQHKSPLESFSTSNLPKEIIDYRVDSEKSLKSLLDRCPACKELHENLIEKGKTWNQNTQKVQ